MDSVEPLRFLFAFLFVLSLIAGMAWGLRRYAARVGQGMFGVSATGNRLSIVEVRHIDPKRKLVLVRRDRMEHLLLLTHDRELVIESHVAPVMMVPPPAPPVDDNANA